jgi:hypothetical protein
VNDDLLSRLRAYAAANPTDVSVVAETARQGAELDAYRELAVISRRWRLRNDAAKRVARAECRATVHALMVRTLRGGMRAPVLEEEPFLLARRLTTQTLVRRAGDWFSKQYPKGD